MYRQSVLYSNFTNKKKQWNIPTTFCVLVWIFSEQSKKSSLRILTIHKICNGLDRQSDYINLYKINNFFHTIFKNNSRENYVYGFIYLRDGNPAKNSADSDSGFYCIFFALRIRVSDFNFNNINI